MRMNITGNQFKILNGVIKFVPIDMVNKFAWKKFSSKLNLHQQPMFKELFFPFMNSLISLNGCCSLTRGLLMTEMRISIPVISKIMFNTHSFFLRLRLAIKALFHNQKYMIETPFCQEGILNNRMNSGKPETDNAVGNPEPSQEYTLGRCRDYRKGLVPLITGLSVRHESDEIVRSL